MPGEAFSLYQGAMRMTSLHPYLFFNGNCREAMEFYQKILGGELQVMTYSDAPEMEAPNVPKHWVMHAALTKDKLMLMASDGMSDTAITPGDYAALALGVDSMPETESWFKSLSEKGQVLMPLEETFWAKRFGMLVDQFGIRWMISYEGK